MSILRVNLHSDNKILVSGIGRFVPSTITGFRGLNLEREWGWQG